MTTSPLPPLYARWLEEALGGAIPNESRSTCSSCTMIPAAVVREDDPPTVQFRAESKCCTYQPDLHNFLVGSLLDDPEKGTAWAKEMISLRFRKRVGVTPFGIRPDALGELLYERIVEQANEAFGRLREVRCPYFIQQGGMCGVWKHRNAVCSTWFCKYERGATGMAFWKVTLGLLRAVEGTLAMWCVHELDPGPSAKAALLALAQRRDSLRDHVEGISDEAYRTIWGTWLGRERELYRECAARVAALSWSDVRRIGGPELAMLEDIVKVHFDALLSSEVPERVEAGRDVVVQIHPRKPGTLRTALPRLGYDPLDIPTELYAVLPEVVGRDPRAAFDELHAAGRIPRVDDALLRRLVDYGLLVATRA